MIFNKVLGIQNIDEGKFTVNRRQAVRAVIINGNKILMIHTNKGDYKFPGGGVKKEEEHKEAVVREVQEETGYRVTGLKDKIGVVVERNLDSFEKNAVFEMVSHYYICKVSKEQGNQLLDDYEAELDFKPLWIEVKEAIARNKELLEKKSNDINKWVNRETAVLEALSCVTM